MLKTTNAQFSVFLPFFLSMFLPVSLPIPQKGTEGFWKSVAHYVPREPTEIRILNPFFIQEAAFQFIGLPFNNGLMGKGVRHMQPHTYNVMIFFCQMFINLLIICTFPWKYESGMCAERGKKASYVTS